MKKITKILLAAAVLVLVFAVNVPAVSYKAGGECGEDARWSLDNDGNFRIYGHGEAVGWSEWRDYNKDIRTLTVEEGITALRSDYMFTGASSLTTVKLPGTLKMLGEGCFWDCTSLKTISLPNGLEKIEQIAFKNCTSLTNIEIPATVNSIGNEAFSYSGLTSITIPSSVRNVEQQVFLNCKNLRSASINASGTIWNAAFNGCTSLETVKMGSGVKSIKWAAFEGCSNLRNLTIGKNVTLICEFAFKDCISLKEVKIPDSVEEMGESFSYGVFSGCKALEKVSVGSGMKKIKNNTFENCTSLKEIRFYGAAPQFEGNEIFKGCGNITAYYPKNNTTWDPSVLTNHGAPRIDWYEWTLPLSYFAPTLKSVTNINGGIQVKWDKMANVTGYVVERKIGNGKWAVAKTITSGSTTSWTDKSVKNGQRYTYQIRGTRGEEKSNVSRAVYRYYLPINTVSLSKSGKTFTAKWKANSSSTGYQVQTAKNSKFSSAKTYTVSNRKTTYKKITPGFRGRCYVRVRTYKTVNGTKFYSAWSSTKYVNM